MKQLFSTFWEALYKHNQARIQNPLRWWGSGQLAGWKMECPLNRMENKEPGAGDAAPKPSPWIRTWQLK